MIYYLTSLCDKRSIHYFYHSSVLPTYVQFSLSKIQCLFSQSFFVRLSDLQVQWHVCLFWWKRLWINLLVGWQGRHWQRWVTAFHCFFRGHSWAGRIGTQLQLLAFHFCPVGHVCGKHVDSHWHVSSFHRWFCSQSSRIHVPPVTVMHWHCPGSHVSCAWHAFWRQTVLVSSTLKWIRTVLQQTEGDLRLRREFDVQQDNGFFFAFHVISIVLRDM